MNIAAVNTLPKVKEMRDAANVAELIKLLSSKKGIAGELKKLADLKEEILKMHAKIEKVEAGHDDRLKEIADAEAKTLKQARALNTRLDNKKADLEKQVTANNERDKELGERAKDVAKREKALASAEKKVAKKETDLDDIIAGHKKRADTVVKKAAKATEEAEAAKAEYEELTAQVRAALPSGKKGA